MWGDLVPSRSVDKLGDRCDRIAERGEYIMSDKNDMAWDDALGRYVPPTFIPKNLPDDHKGKPPKPVNWRKVEEGFLDSRQLRRKRTKKIERVLWLLLGFVIGALAMYTSFPK